MFFRDLLKLEVDRFGRIDRQALPVLPIPDDVLEQVCIDHGHNSGFQEQYGAIDLDCSSWRLEKRPARDLIQASVYPSFDRVERVSASVTEESWSNADFDARAHVAQYWRVRRSWMRPPVLIQDWNGSSLHLVEGHTRLGFLKGLIRIGAINEDSVHDVWIGRVSVQ